MNPYNKQELELILEGIKERLEKLPKSPLYIAPLRSYREFLSSLLEKTKMMIEQCDE
jgi:hypothetical protein